MRTSKINTKMSKFYQKDTFQIFSGIATLKQMILWNSLNTQTQSLLYVGIK